MTSEGQYAGTQPAEATSGGPTSDGFPPDSDGRRVAGRASAATPPTDGFPSSYAPPPPATPNGGSPFVVPTVRSFGSGSESAAANPDRPTGTPYGSARVPQPDDASPYGSVSPGGSSSYGSAAPPAASSPFDQPDGATFVPASGNAPEPPRSAWAPQQATGDGQIPLPQRTPANVDPGKIGEFDGFAAATGRNATPDQPAADPAIGRPPGVSAFGGQRSRVPGATLSGLPDAPPPTGAARPGDSGGFPPAHPEFPPAGGGSGDSNGFAAADGFPAARPGDGFPAARPADGFPAATPGDGFPAARPGDGFPAARPGDGFPAARPGDGFPAARRPGDGFPAGRPADGLPAARPGDAFPAARPADGFPAASPGEGARPAEGGGFPLRSGNATFPTRRGDSGGFPLRSAATPTGAESAPEPPAAPAAPSSDLPIRSHQAPPDPAVAGSAFSAFGSQPTPGSADEAPHPYGRPADAATPQDASSDPFGRRPAAGDPFGRPAADEPFGRSTTDEPFGRPAADDSIGRPGVDDSIGRPGVDDSIGRPATDDPFGRRPGADDQGDPFGRSAAGAFGQRPGGDGQADPFGRRPGDDEGDPFGRRPAAEQADQRHSGLPDPFGRGDSSFGSAPETAGSPFGTAKPAEGATYGSARPASPANPFDGGSSFGGDDARPVYGSARPGPDGESGESDSHAMYRRPDGNAPDSSGFPHHAAPDQNRSVPAPRDPSEPAAPAVGSARPVTASASVPSGNLGAPIDPAELPPPPAASQARVYGRPAESKDEEPADEPGFPAPTELPFDTNRPAIDGNRPPFEDIRPASGGHAAPPPFAPPAGSGSAAVPGAFGSPAGSGSAAVPGPFGSPAGSGSAAVPGPFGSPDGPGSAAPGLFGASAGSAGSGPFGASAGAAAVPGPFGSPAASASSSVPDAFDEPTSYGSAVAGPGSPAYPQRPGDPDAPGVSGLAPQSPARATARASASARVAPPAPANPAPGEPGPDFGQHGPGGAPGQHGPGFGQQGPGFGEQDGPGYGRPAPGFGPDGPGSGQAFGQPGYGPDGPGSGQRGPVFGQPAPGFGPSGPEQRNEQYGEMTTDIAGRGNDAYGSPVSGFPMPSSPETSGAASRATVTPPGPEDTTSWPGPAEQGRFDQFKAEEKPAKPETPHVRMLPILVAVIVGAVLLLGVVFGIVYLVAGDKGETLTVKAGECVKQEGSEAVKVDCGDAGSFEIVQIVGEQAQCPDPNQPHVLNPTGGGKNQVLCLKPHS